VPDMTAAPAAEHSARPRSFGVDRHGLI
jgi:hypothetical protein